MRPDHHNDYKLTTPPRNEGSTKSAYTATPSSDLIRRRVRLRGTSAISVPVLIVILFPCLVIIVICILFFRHPSEIAPPPTHAGAPDNVRRISDRYDNVFVSGCQPVDNDQTRANAVFIMLARNEELDGVVKSIKSIEKHFNRWFNYPYVLLNDGEFNSSFVEKVQSAASGTVQFGHIEPSMWSFPNWADKQAASEGIQQQGDAAIMYGGLDSYHHMCRFYSGFFYKHKLLQGYEWFWRLEPDVKYFCDITYDPFLEMAKRKKVYGFTIAVKELKETIPNIFRYASSYMRDRNATSKGLWEMFTIRPQDDPSFTAEKDPRLPILQEKSRLRGPGELPFIDYESMEGEVYNRCHFWSNFEIARFDFFRSDEYDDFFQYMDRSGGFWMERWGDAPVHSLAAGILLAPSQVHYFRDIGYRHSTIQHCPANAPGRQLAAEHSDNLDDDEDALRTDAGHRKRPDPPRENGVGCRCRCDPDLVEVEGKDGSCIAEWVESVGGWASP